MSSRLFGRKYEFFKKSYNSEDANKCSQQGEQQDKPAFMSEQLVQKVVF
jgi:hypothetical protein